MKEMGVLPTASSSYSTRHWIATYIQVYVVLNPWSSHLRLYMGLLMTQLCDFPQSNFPTDLKLGAMENIYGVIIVYISL